MRASVFDFAAPDLPGAAPQRRRFATVFAWLGQRRVSAAAADLRRRLAGFWKRRLLSLHDAQRCEYRGAVSRLGTPVSLDPWELGQLALIRKPRPSAVAPSSVVSFIARSARS